MYKNDSRKNLFRAYCAVCALVMMPIGAGLRAGAQAASKDVAFEVATVKPVLIDASHRFNPRHFWVHVNPGGASYWSMTPVSLITYAYGVEPMQVTGPEWANTDRFDIEARFPEGADPKDERKMLQALLADRFKLAFHVEKRELEVSVLIVGKHGQKLRPSPPDPASPESDAPVKAENPGEEPAKPKITTTQDGASQIDQGKRGTFSVKIDQEHWANHFEMSKTTMGELAGRLSNCLGSGVHKVVDETGIKGNYQVAFDCPLPFPRPAPGGGTVGTLPPDPEDGSLLTRSLDLLGLKLEKRKILMDVYVIDHVDRPSEN